MHMNRLEEICDDHSIHKLGYHLVWCTKYRHPILVNGVDDTVKRVIAQTCGLNNWICKEIEVMPDHVHLFIQAPHTVAPADIVHTLKSTSAIAVFYAHPKLKGQKFWGTGLWSRGTYYGSVGCISQESIIKYIQNQKSKGKL